MKENIIKDNMTDKEKAKIARRVYNREWYQAHKEEVQARNARYWEKKVRKKLTHPVTDEEFAELVRLEKLAYNRNYAKQKNDKRWAKKFDEMVRNNQIKAE